MRTAAYSPGIGISAIGLYEPPWILSNEWFDGTLPSKFVQHTGIESRRVSLDDEVTMAARALRNLQRATGCRLRDCAGVVFAASSLLPSPIGKKYAGKDGAWGESLGCAAQRFVKRLGVAGASVAAINWGCSGYAKALEIARCRAAGLGKGQFILAVTVNRTSKITDYSCPQTAGLFGDFAQATLLARSDSDRYPVHFALLSAHAETAPVQRRVLRLSHGRECACAHGGRRTPLRVHSPGLLTQRHGGRRCGVAGDGCRRGKGALGRRR